MLDMRNMRYFVATYEEGSITAAAKRCFIAQPSISNAILQLEESLGTRLFIRHKKGVRATQEGHDLYPLVRRLLAEADAIGEHFRRSTTPAIRLGMLPTLPGRRVEQIVHEIRGTAPGAAIYLVNSQAECDLCFTIREYVPVDWQFQSLWREDYVLALPESSHLALHDELTADDLSGIPLIGRVHCELKDRVQQRLEQEYRLDADLRASTDNDDWALTLVACGMGVAIVPESVAASRQDVLVRRPPILADLNREVGVAFHPTALHQLEFVKPLVSKLRTLRWKPVSRAG